MSSGLHEDEIDIDVNLVRSLVDRDRPEFASLPLTALDQSGSSNALFRLGEELLVRIPRQPGGTLTIEKEATYLPLFAKRLPVAVPEVVAIGQPGFGYPERWSLVRWLDGVVPLFPQTNESARTPLADDLARVVAAIQEIEVPPGLSGDPSVTWYRGGPLAARDAPTREAIAHCRSLDGLDLDLGEAVRVWDEAMRLPSPQLPPEARWFHGDLFAENLLARDNRLIGVLDFGGVGIGDPTIDLIVAWEVLDRTAREQFRRALAVDEPTWLRARAWALSLALIVFPYYWQTMPIRCAQKSSVARAVLASVD